MVTMISELAPLTQEMSIDSATGTCLAPTTVAPFTVPGRFNVHSKEFDPLASAIAGITGLLKVGPGLMSGNAVLFVPKSGH